MMVGSIFYNCWAGLITFTIYFLVTLLQNSYLPSQILLGSFITAVLTFLGMFGVRLLVGYILYTPKEELFEGNQLKNFGESTKDDTKKNTSDDKTSTVEFEDESSEEIAKVVRTLMSFDDNQTVSNK